MNIDIVKEKETPLLGRKRFTMWADYQGSTPSRVKFCNEIANKLKVSKNLVVIRHIYTRFGEQRSKLLIHVYDDEKTMIELEGKNLIDKHKVEEKKTEEKKKEKPKDKKEENSAAKNSEAKDSAADGSEAEDSAAEGSEAEGSEAEATEERPAEEKKEENKSDEKKDETPEKSEKSTGKKDEA